MASPARVQRRRCSSSCGYLGKGVVPKRATPLNESRCWHMASALGHIVKYFNARPRGCMGPRKKHYGDVDLAGQNLGRVLGGFGRSGGGPTGPTGTHESRLDQTSGDRESPPGSPFSSPTGRGTTTRNHRTQRYSSLGRGTRPV